MKVAQAAARHQLSCKTEPNYCLLAVFPCCSRPQLTQSSTVQAASIIYTSARDDVGVCRALEGSPSRSTRIISRDKKYAGRRGLSGGNHVLRT